MFKKRSLKTRVIFIILMLLQVGVYAQVKTITGTVKDDQGNPLAKATVSAKGAKKGVATETDGSFSITVPTETTTLSFSFSGYQTKNININNNQTSVNVALTEEVTKLDSVVVVAYGTQKAKDVTGAITQIKGDAVKNLATQDVGTMLQGRVAGVDVVASSGQPGASSQITIRGVSSLNNPSPLYVIDGVIQPNGNNNINPQDIESMSILKDASATAIYGSAAAGGVILITTKKGKGAKPTVSLSSRFSLSTPELVQLLNKNDFVTYEKDIKNSYYSDPGNAALISSLLPVDWNKELYRNGMEQNYTISVSGATPNVNYYLSGIYNDQSGVFLDNTSSMVGARVNTDVKISNSIKIGEQLNVWERSTIPVKTPIVSTPFESQPVFQGGPVYSAIPGTTWGIYPFSYDGFNTVAQIKTSNFQFPANSFQAQAYLELKLPIKYMTFKTTVGYTYQSFENNILQSQYTTNGTLLVDSLGQVQNHLYRNIGNYSQTLNAYILAYDHLWGKHTVNLLAGFEQYVNKNENLVASIYNVNSTSYSIFPSSESLISGNTTVTPSSYDPQGLKKSVFGRINYDYNKRYYATVTVRRDGNATTFGQNFQYGIFPSVSTGWNIDQERFFKKIRPVINQLKLRASYGEIGNDQIGSYQFSTTYNSGIVQNFTPGGPIQVSYTQQGIANEDVHWETTKETNIGVDGQLLEGKLYFTIDWYNKNTDGVLYNVPVSPSSGVPTSGTGFAGGTVTAGTLIENLGAVQNRGLDIAVGYSGKARQVNYSVSATGSFNTNKVLNIATADGLPDGFNSYPYGTSIWGASALTRTYDGSAFGQFWGLKTLGIYKQNDPRLNGAPSSLSGSAPQAGDLIFYDRNHDGVISPDDDTAIGNPYPKFTFGISMTASWKNFDISLLFNGVMGVQLYNGVTPYEFESLDNSNVTSKVFQSSGFANNGVTKYPSIGHTDGFGNYNPDPYDNYTTPSSYFVENGSYLKLKNLQIGYSLSNKLLEKVKIKTLRIYVMANNIFTLTKYTGVDPELGSQYAILSLDKNGNVVGNANGTSNYGSTNNTGITGYAATSRGIDGPNKYPNVKLYAAGVDLTF